MNITYFPPLFPGLCTVVCTHSPCPFALGLRGSRLGWLRCGSPSLQVRPIVSHTQKCSPTTLLREAMPAGDRKTVSEKECSSQGDMEDPGPCSHNGEYKIYRMKGFRLDPLEYSYIPIPCHKPHARSACDVKGHRHCRACERKSRNNPLVWRLGSMDSVGLSWGISLVIRVRCRFLILACV